MWTKPSYLAYRTQVVICLNWRWSYDWIEDDHMTIWWNCKSIKAPLRAPLHFEIQKCRRTKIKIKDDRKQKSWQDSVMINSGRILRYLLGKAWSTPARRQRRRNLFMLTLVSSQVWLPPLIPLAFKGSDRCKLHRVTEATYRLLLIGDQEIRQLSACNKP